jgi:ATP synthase protein I
VTGAVTALACVVAGVVGGWGSLVAVLAGAAVVTGFFCVSALVIAWAGGIGDAFALPAALGTFLVKMLVLVAVLGTIPEDGWLDRVTLAWTVVVGALLWGAVQARWVWTRQLYYVTPPAPVRPDPESPAPRA